MILIVSGVTNVASDLHQQQQNNHFQQEKYNSTTKEQLKQQVAEDFGKILEAEINKLKIDILV